MNSEWGATTRIKSLPGSCSESYPAASSTPLRQDFDPLLNIEKDLLISNRGYLTHRITNWIFSRPGIIADSIGSKLPVSTDTYNGAGYFETTQSCVISIGT